MNVALGNAYPKSLSAAQTLFVHYALNCDYHLESRMYIQGDFQVAAGLCGELWRSKACNSTVFLFPIVAFS